MKIIKFIVDGVFNSGRGSCTPGFFKENKEVMVVPEEIKVKKVKKRSKNER